jgi:hypothetical protein
MKYYLYPYEPDQVVPDSTFIFIGGRSADFCEPTDSYDREITEWRVR